jgi:hypothetical protein
LSSPPASAARGGRCVGVPPEIVLADWYRRRRLREFPPLLQAFATPHATLSPACWDAPFRRSSARGWEGATPFPLSGARRYPAGSAAPGSPAAARSRRRRAWPAASPARCRPAGACRGVSRMRRSAMASASRRSW